MKIMKGEIKNLKVPSTRHYINSLNICVKRNIFKVVSEYARREGRGTPYTYSNVVL
jgi:hypothetical protein